ncbi:MAG: hypothetical protein MJZ92_04685 [Paludibacteraceae bacterium]|nr:hypothetical protein [Paludibacteraceae bacterium]
MILPFPFRSLSAIMSPSVFGTHNEVGHDQLYICTLTQSAVGGLFLFVFG